MIRNSGGGGGMAGSSISVDFSQHGNEADKSLCTFTCFSPANVTSNFGRNVLMGMQNMRSDIPGGWNAIQFLGSFLVWKRG